MLRLFSRFVHGIRTGSASRASSLVLALALIALAALSASAHETKAVGDEGQFLISFGFRHEPIYTDDLNGLEFIVRRAADGEPIEFLEQSMLAEIIAPDGVARRQLTLRGVWGQPGVYTADLVLTEPGVYGVRLWGFIDDVEFDELFHSHEVTAVEEIYFP